MTHALIVSTGSVLLVVLTDEHIERIKRQDPFVLELGRIPELQLSARAVGIVHASESDMQRILDLVHAGDPEGALAYATRGFENRPDLGDGAPYEAIVPEPVQ